MRTSRYLIVADPIEKLMPEFDLGVCLSRELLSRGFEVDYLDLLASDRSLDSDAYLAALPIQPVLAAPEHTEEFWVLGEKRTRPIDDYHVVLQRKDPPVNTAFVEYHQHFEAAPEHIVQINRPPQSYTMCEHTAALDFPKYAAPTAVCRSLADLISAVRALDGEVVCKPKNTYCGIGIMFFMHDEPEENLEVFWKQWQPEVVVQPFLEEIENSGDLRILTINDTVLGSVLRVPKEGSRLANLHQGATSAALAPTEHQLSACRDVARALNPKGLYLLGLDFIGEYLTEINFTSPTTIVQINQVNNIRADRVLVDELEKMVAGRRG